MDKAQFCKFVPLPGTKLFNIWLKDSSIKNLENIDWNKFNFYGQNIFPTYSLSAKEIAIAQKKAFITFYFRLNIILKIILKIKLSQMKFLVRRFIEYIIKQ